jgi:hypothetical protein
LDMVLLAEGRCDLNLYYGPNLEQFLQSVRTYDFDRVHGSLRERFNADTFLISPGPLLPVAFHWLDVDVCREFIDRSLLMWKRVLEEPNQAAEGLGYVFGLSIWGFVAAVLPGLLTPVQKATVARLFVSLDLTWASIEATIDSYAGTHIRERGSTVLNTCILSVEMCVWLLKAAYASIAQDPSITKATVLQVLPSIEVVINGVCTHDFGSVANAAFGGGNWNAFVALAQLCEKFELWQQALVYCNAAINPDLTKGGCELPTPTSVALMIKGRSLAALGRLMNAAEALEEAASIAHGIA